MIVKLLIDHFNVVVPRLIPFLPPFVTNTFKRCQIISQIIGELAAPPTPYWEQSPQQIPDIAEEEKDGLSDKSEKYLRKIIDFMKKSSIKAALPHCNHMRLSHTFPKVTQC